MAIGAGALLVRSNLITSAQLEEARSHQAQHGGTIGEYLVLHGLVDDEVLTGFYHSRLMVPRSNPNQLARLPRRTIAKVPGDMATEFRLVPVGLDAEQNLTVVMSDPSDTHAVDELGFFTGCYVMRAVATQRQIAWCLAHYYGFVSSLGETLLEDSRGAGATGNVEETAEALAGKLSPANGVPRPVRGPGPVTKQVRASQHRVIPPVADTADTADSKPREHLGPTSPLTMRGPAVARSPASESGPTRPIRQVRQVRQVRRPPNQEPNPPELAARAGEISVPDPNDDMPTTGIQALPAVVIIAAGESDYSKDAMGFKDSVAVEDDPIVAITEVEENDALPPADDAHGSNDSDSSNKDGEDSGEVVLLDRPTRSSNPPTLELMESSPADPNDPVVVLDRPKRRSRTNRITNVGIGVAASDQDVTAEPVHIELPAGPRVPTDRPPVPEPMNRSAIPVAIEPAARQVDADATSRYQRVAAAPGSGDNDEDDDEFGPPGTTIPPPFLGAMPDSDQSGPQNAIPLNLPDDPSAAATVATTNADPMVTLADAMSEVADNQRELDLSSARLLPTLRALDAAPTRDAIVEALLDFMTRSFNRATFFVVRADNLTPFRSKLGANTTASLTPGWKSAKLRLSVPSTFRDVLQNRLPFRGHLPDRASLAFAERIFGTASSETLLVPCTVRDRPVGVLCGCDRSARIFHEHLSLVTRGASDAFERIIKTRRS